MKFLLAVLSCAVSATAAPLACEGGGFALTVDDSKHAATLLEKGKPVEFGMLDCTPEKTKLTCISRGVADAGFIVYVHMGKQPIAEVNRESFVGPHKAADLKCH